MPARVLGCSRNMRAVVFPRAGGRQVKIRNPEQISWQRVLDGTSEAGVVARIRGRECCSGLTSVRPWSHQLALFRDNELVWEGPITTVKDSRLSSAITLSARDITEWASHRVIRAGYSFLGTAAADLSTIAAAAIRASFALDDPGVTSDLTVYPTGIVAERQVDADTTILAEDLSDLAQLGLNYTAVGRRWILFGDGSRIGNIGNLPATSFSGDIDLVWDGLNVANRVIVTGNAVRGVAEVDPGRYGVLESIVQADGVLDSASAAASARAVIAGTFPPEAVLTTTGSLRPDAPVTISQLVPGVLAVTAARGACQSITQRSRMESLQVDWTREGESVQPKFAPLPRVA